MQLTVCAWDDRVFSIECDPDETVENVKAILEAESGLPSAQQSLVANNRPLDDDRAKLSSAGVGAGDVLMLFPVQPQAQQAQAGGGGAAGAGNPAMRLAPDGSAVSPAAFIAAVKAAPGVLANMMSSYPALGQAITNEDWNALQEHLRHVHMLNSEAAQDHELDNADPFDMEAQRKIEAIIHKKNIEENYMAAMDNSPEVFAQVQMLYVNLVINGVPVQAFVDSGAQMTIMTEAFAHKCHLGRLMDRRFEGMAVGVGSTPIIGRVHQAPLQVAGHHTTTSITVLKQKSGPQLIFGLDMLRRHQCTINLRLGCLEFGSCDAVLPFLGESEIPKEAEEDPEASASGAGTGAVSHAPGALGGASTSDSPASAAGAAAAARAAGAGAPPTAAAAAPPPAAAPAPAAGGGGGGAEEAKIMSLVALGFPREQCIQALQQTNGDPDAAGAILFGGF